MKKCMKVSNCALIKAYLCSIGDHSITEFSIKLDYSGGRAAKKTWL